MNQTTAITFLDTLERRLRPALPPWNWDKDVRTEWIELVTHYDEPAASQAFKALERHHGAQSKWPNWVQLRDALNKARRRTLEPDNQPTDTPCPPSIGTALAWEAYTEECVRLGKHPDEKRFNRWLKPMVTTRET